MNSAHVGYAELLQGKKKKKSPGILVQRLRVMETGQPP